MLEIAVNDDFVNRTVQTLSAAVAGDPAARIYVLPIDSSVQIYRAVRGPEAV
jgi:nitrogen regulatory protein PII